MELKFYCPAPWHGTFLTPTYSAVCCMRQGVPTNNLEDFFVDSHIKDLRQSFVTGELDKDCRFCQKTDQDGGHSLAKRYTNTYREVGIVSGPDIDANNFDAVLKPEYLELRFSNQCNFACRICWPEWSNRIGEEAEANPTLKTLYHGSRFDIQTVNSKFVSQLLKYVDQYKWINIAGGEPMMMPEAVEFLDRVVELGHAENITLHLTTNVSTINNRIIERLKKFKHVVITLSIDAIDESAEYIRYGTVWKHIDRNLKFYNDLALECPNFVMTFNMTFSAYALFGLDKTLTYLSQWRNSNCHWLGGNLAQGPTNPYHLGGTTRHRAIDELTKAIEVLPKLMSDKPDIETLASQLVSLRTVLETQTPNDKDWQKLVEQTTMIDNVRRQSFRDVYGFELNS